MKIFNLNSDEWDRTEDREGRKSKDARVAHQIRNDTDAPVRVLMLSTLLAPDRFRVPRHGQDRRPQRRRRAIMFGKPGPELDYWEGED